MRKVFRYECRRLLLNKFFAGLVLVLLAYGAHGAGERDHPRRLPHRALLPLELWGLSQPDAALLWVGASFFLTFFTSGRARRAMALTDGRPHGRPALRLARCAAALAGTALLALCCLLEAAAFYGRYFGWYAWGSLLLPALATLVPALAFALGCGWLLARIRPLAALSVDAPALRGGGPAPARSAGLWNGSLFTRPPAHSGDAGPGVHTARRSVIAQLVLLECGTIALFVRPKSPGIRAAARRSAEAA